MVVLDLYGDQVTLDNGEWQDPPEALREDLDALVAYAHRRAVGYIPDMDLHVAETMERLIGARILKHTPPALKKGTVA